MMVTEGGRFFITCMDCHSWGSSQRLPDLPMVSERIDDSPYAPTKGLVIHRPDDSGSCGNVSAQDHLAHTQAKPATLMQGYGDLHHPVSTENAQAQQFFDQGLRQIYAFNHDEAARSFQRAADLDTKLAMAYWGVAEAVGPNYNDPASDDRFRAAHTAIQKAVDLSGNASPAEQAYIKAMALRFPADPKADLRQAAEAYHDAMREVAKQFPDDLDAATLFAESGMHLHP